jgi:alpha-mannosidase
MIVSEIVMKKEQPENHGFETVFVVPHAHFDLSWLGTPDECEKINNRIIAQALYLLESDTEYRYSIENVRPIERFLIAHPEEMEKVGRLFKSSRLEICGAYADVVADYCFDESLARNFYYGQGWIERTFGSRTRIVREEDVPGHFAQLPQLVAGSGHDFLKISRGPRGAFRWIAPDGSSTVAALYEYGDGFHFRIFQNPDGALQNLPRYLDWVKTRVEPPLPILLLMDGDDCSTPSPDLPAAVRLWNDRIGKPTMRIATVSEFMESLPVEKLRARRGGVPGPWGAIMAFQQEAARELARVEPLITAAEKFDAVHCFLLGAPPSPLDDAWRSLIAAQDHNWGGKDKSKNGVQADKDKFQMIAAAADIAENTLDMSLNGITANIAKSRAGLALTIFNPLAWNRTDAVEFEIPQELAGSNFEIVGPRGENVPFQIQSDPGNGGRRAATFIARNAPPMGYETYYLTPCGGAAPNEPAARRCGRDQLENDYYRIEPAARGNGISRIFDREISLDVAGPNRGGLLGPLASRFPFLSLFALGARFTIPPPEYFENFENIINHGTGEKVEFLWKLWGPSRFSNEKTEITAGPVSSRMTITGNFLGSRARHVIVMYNGMKRLDFRTRIDWAGRRGVFLAMLFPLPFKHKDVHVNTPFYVDRIGDEAKGFESGGTPAGPKIRGVHNWFNVSDGSRSVTISSPWRVWDFSFFPAALLMASDERNGFFAGDYYLNRGRREYSFSLTSSRAGWKDAVAYRRGLEPVYPLAARVRADGGGAPAELPERLSFCSASPRNVVVTALKNCGGGKSLFIRFYEVEGKAAEVAIEFPFAVKEAFLTDLIEKDTATLRHEGNRVYCTLKPHEIGNIRVVLKKD